MFTSPRLHRLCEVGNDICSGIPLGNSRRLRDYSRHPLREYIIAWRVYVSSYDRHFRFRRALLTSFRFWPRKCVYTTLSSVAGLPREERSLYSSCTNSQFSILPNSIDSSRLTSHSVCKSFTMQHRWRSSYNFSFLLVWKWRSAINVPRDAS